MAITVKHSKVSTIPDGTDTSVVRPSDWNADHTLTGTIPVDNGGTGASTLTGYVKGNGTAAMTASATVPSTDVTGLGTMSTQNSNNISVTGGSMSGVTISDYVATATKGVANGVASLDGSGTVPISQLPSAVLGALSYQGTWNASTNTPTLTSSVGTKGYYYVVSVAGSTNLNGITDWVVGDWAVYNGTAWQKVDNTDAVTSVNGYTGTVVLTQSDITGTVAIANGGTGQTTATAGFNALAPNQSGNTGKYLTTDGTNTSWAANAGGDVVGPASATDNAVARFDTTTGKLLQNSVTLIDDTGNASGILSQQFSNGSAVTLAAGKMWYDGSTGAWNAGMGGGNITQQIGEELFVYGKASATITDSPLQIIYQTGTVGASGVITFAPTTSGITDGTLILGIATESLALNGFGRITAFGVVRGITTNGTAFGETWADGDEIYYNPVTGNPTNVKPVAPNVKVSVGTLIKAGSGGSGSIQVEVNHGSVLGGTDSNVQLNGVSNGQIISYDGGNGYWKNTDLTAGTGISISETVNGVLTVTNTSPSSGGTVTSVTGTAPVVSSGGNTPAISMAAATGSVNGYLTSTDWTTFNNKGSGTVTSVATGTGLSGGPITGTGTISLANTAVTPAAYTNANITVDAQGRITSASNGSGGSGTVTSVAATVPSLLSVSGSPITTSGTLAFTYSGTALPVANGGSGQTSYTDGQLLIGNSTGNTLTKATLTAGIGISVTNGAGSITIANTSLYTISYLIVGGGGGGGYNRGGGAGAGGVLSGTNTITRGVPYTFVVGGGGAGATALGTTGVTGTSSTAFSLTALGGGGGASSQATTGRNGGNGASGGGGSTDISTGTSYGSGGSGTTGQGFAGGSANGATAYAGGGGGGSSAVGGNATTTVAGSGGAGTASSITGSSVTYAGGGGGSVYSSDGTAGSGGAGGGGAGGAGSATVKNNGVAGTANTGGGGGGGNAGPGAIFLGDGGQGGSGVIIISIPTANYTGTTTGSPTVTTSGSNTILTFTASGSYTA